MSRTARTAQEVTVGGQPYNELYDPLKSRAGAGQQQCYAPTYWVDTAGTPPADDGPLMGDLDADVVIVGAGLTGLACAMVLAEQYGIKATVLEANQTAWGCSSRNGGQALNDVGRLKRSDWIQRWGKVVAFQLEDELNESFAHLRTLTQEIDCDAIHEGYLRIAHNQRGFRALSAEAKFARDVFGHDVTLLTADEVKENYVNDHESHGGLHGSSGIGVHPLKLAFGYLRRARTAGATVRPLSPVLDIESRGDSHYVRTPRGTVRARAVAIATNGYTNNDLHASLRSRIMPVLSNSLVTRVLTEGEIDSIGFRTRASLYDTRTLRFYYRLLPDNRLQIGSRASVTGHDAANIKHQKVLVDGLSRKFPALENIQIDYMWWGWVGISHDAMPRMFQPDLRRQLYYAAGYSGCGVAFSQHAARRMAERIAGKTSPVFDLPIYQTPLKYPCLFNAWESRMFSPFRRIGQRMLYPWYGFMDNRK